MSFVVGRVAACEKVAGKDKLSKLEVDVGAAEKITLVTNAPNVSVSDSALVVVAPPGCTLPDGTEVKKATVGGVPSEGMLCDAPMLGWVGGGAGAAALVPAHSFSPGDAPPSTRPRMDAPKEEASASAPPAIEQSLFEKKLSKEEKKAAAAAKKAERDAKKADKKKAPDAKGGGGDSGSAAVDVSDEVGSLSLGEDELVSKVPPEDVKKGGYAMIRGMPCRLTEVTTMPKATANGNNRLHLVGLHIFTGKKYDDTLNLTAGFHGIDVPVTRKAAYTLLDVDKASGYLSLLTDGGATKEDAALGRGEGGEDFDSVGTEILRRFDAGEGLKVTVLAIMGKDLVIDVVKDTQ